MENAQSQHSSLPPRPTQPAGQLEPDDLDLLDLFKSRVPALMTEKKALQADVARLETKVNALTLRLKRATAENEQNRWLCRISLDFVRSKMGSVKFAVGLARQGGNGLRRRLGGHVEVNEKLANDGEGAGFGTEEDDLMDLEFLGLDPSEVDAGQVKSESGTETEQWWDSDVGEGE